MADLFTDFKGISVTLAVMAQALIDGRIDCKTAGRLVVHLQTISKLLWLYHRGHRGTQKEKALTTKDTKEHEGLPQICADERRLSTSRLSNKTEQVELRVIQMASPSAIARDIHVEDSRVVFEAKARPFPESRTGCRDGRCRDGPGQQPRAA
jgi:hypothetical protein